jgi:hypothetical protein
MNEEESNDGHRKANTETNGGSSQGASDGAGADSAPVAGQGTSGTGTPAVAGGIVGYVMCVQSSSGWTAALPAGAISMGVMWQSGHSGFVPVVAYGYATPPPPEPKLESVPPEVGEIIAWRAWQVVKTGGGHRLKSVTQKNVWAPDEPMYGVPGLYYEGIYAAKTRDAIAGSDYATYNVIGEVALWGDVVEHERGYRAQYAKVMSLKLLPILPAVHGKNKNDHLSFPEGEDAIRLINELRRTYGLPYEPPPKKRWGRTIMKWALWSVLAVCWSILIYDVIQWLTQTPAQ